MSFRIKTAKMIAKIAHEGQKYGDKDYFEEHIERVVDTLKVLLPTMLVKHDNYVEVIVVGYLHDIIEDTSITYEELVETFGWEIANYVNILTKPCGFNHKEDNIEYLTNIVGSNVPRLVKIADTLCNMNACIADGDTKRTKKYQEQLQFLLG